MTIDVLCMESKLNWRKLLKKAFQLNLTPHVDVAENYDTAMQKIKLKRYDLIVLSSPEESYFKIYDAIQEIPHGNVIIFSTTDYYAAEAKKKDIPFYILWDAIDNIATIADTYRIASK